MERAAQPPQPPLLPLLLLLLLPGVQRPIAAGPPCPVRQRVARQRLHPHVARRQADCIVQPVWVRVPQCQVGMRVVAHPV